MIGLPGFKLLCKYTSTCPPQIQVGDQFNYGVFEHQMMLKGLDFVGIDDMGSDKIKKERIAAKDVMSLPKRSYTLWSSELPAVLRKVLTDNPDLKAFPVTCPPHDGKFMMAEYTIENDPQEQKTEPHEKQSDTEGQQDLQLVDGDFLGMISRTNVELLLKLHDENVKDLNTASSPVIEGPPEVNEAMCIERDQAAPAETKMPGASQINLSPYIEIAPIIIPPNMPLPFIYRIVQSEGFNYVPVKGFQGHMHNLKPQIT
jgi:chloride channel 7